MTLQIRNDEQTDLQSADFQLRYEPNFAWKSAVSALMALPALRGAWPMSSVAYTAADQASDASGQGNHLTNNNTVEFGYDDLVPYANFTAASTEYLSRADGGAGNWADILGTENYILGAQRGLTMGGWFYADALTAIMFAMGKGTLAGVASDSYFIRWRGDVANDPFRGTISDGLAYYGATSTVATVTGTWYHAVVRFVPSTSVDTYVNTIKTSNTTGIPAAINDTTAAFQIGANATPAQYLDGRASMCFLCAAALSDGGVAATESAGGIIGATYQQQRAMFGV